MIDFELKLKKYETYEITNYVGRSMEVNIPQLINNKEVTSIGERAFFECGSLTSITIPYSVISIGEGAFWDCNSLTTIIYKGTIEQWENICKGSSLGLEKDKYNLQFN